MRQNSRGWYCATKLEDGSWCKYKPSGAQPTGGGFTKIEPKETASHRNFDKEAYEKCISIWVAESLKTLNDYELVVQRIEKGFYWDLFQAIRKDGEKRFATGWKKAEATFGDFRDEVPMEAFLNDPEARAMEETRY